MFLWREALLERRGRDKGERVVVIRTGRIVQTAYDSVSADVEVDQTVDVLGDVSRERIARCIGISNHGALNRSSQHLFFLIAWLLNCKRQASGNDVTQLPSDMHATTSLIAHNCPKNKLLGFATGVATTG